MHARAACRVLSALQGCSMRPAVLPGSMRAAPRGWLHGLVSRVTANKDEVHPQVRRMALDRRNYRQLVETTVELANKVRPPLGLSCEYLDLMEKGPLCGRKAGEAHPRLSGSSFVSSRRWA